MRSAAGTVPESVCRALAVLGNPSASIWIRRFLAAPMVSAWPDVAWRASLLTPGGAPVEFSFASTAPDAVRYTVDVCGPETLPQDRLASALDLLARSDLGRPLSPALDLLTTAHHGDHLRWGCWLGGRHRAEAQRFKLYVEVPPARAQSVQTNLGSMLARSRRLLDNLGSLRIVGLDVDSSGIELYYRMGQLDRSGLQAMLAAEGLEHRLGELMDLLERAAGRVLPIELPGANLCASVALTAHGPTLSVIAHCVALLGLDRQCRRRVLELADDAGLDLGPYGPFSQPLEWTPPRDRHHTMLTFSVDSRQPVGLSVGLRPPRGHSA